MNIDIFDVTNIRVNKSFGQHSERINIEWATKDAGAKPQFGNMTLYTKDVEFLVRRLQQCLDAMQPGVDSGGTIIEDVYKND